MKNNIVAGYYAQIVDNVCKITDSYLYDGRIDQAIELAEKGQEIADNDDTDRKDLALMLLQRGKLLNRRSFFGRPAFEEAETILTRARAIATTIADQELLAMTLLRLGQAHDYRTMTAGEGDFQDALDHFERALTLFQATNNREGEGKACFNIGLIHQRRREMEEAASRFSEAYDIAIQGDYRFDQSLAIRHLGFIHFTKGDYELAEKCALESLKLRQELGYRLYLPSAHHVLGVLYIVQEKWEQAMAHLEQAKAMAEEMKLSAYMIQIQLAQGEWYKRQGNNELARQSFRGALEIATEIDHPRWQEAARADLATLPSE